MNSPNRTAVGASGFTLAAIAVLAISTADARSDGGACARGGTVTLSGTVRSLATIQEEPAETPQSVFTLELPRPWCGVTSVFVSMSGPLFCSEGDFATLSGDYFSPASGFPGGPVFEARGLIDCRR